MTRRVPVVATLLVALAIAAMIALGLWQLLIRLPEKEAFLAQLAANPAKPAIAFPGQPDDALLFRRATGRCLPPVAIHLAGAGASGFRAIAQCGGAATPIVQLGTTRDPMAHVAWSGGAVAGYISHAPSDRSLIAVLIHPQPQPLMLVADTPAPGLKPNGAFNLDDVPNNHLAYGVQWFFFAAVAAIIYALALRRRLRGPTERGSLPPFVSSEVEKRWSDAT